MKKDNFQRNSNIIFWQIMLIGSAFFSFLFFVFIKTYPKLLMIGRSFLNGLETVCGCTNHLSFVNHPFIFTSLVLLGIIIASFLIFIVYRTLKLSLSTKKYIRHYLKMRKDFISKKLSTISDILNLHHRIVEINHQKSIIFCYGFLKPKICISEGIVRRLTKRELEAVLRHEQQHITVFEPLKLFLIKLVTKLLFFVPGFSILSKQYITYTELSADQKATRDFKDRVPLARALYKVIKWQKRSLVNNNLALSFFSTVTNERVNKLANVKYSPKFKTPKIKVFIFILFFTTAAILLNLVFSTHTVIASNSNSGELCLQNEGSPIHQCQFVDNQVCAVNYGYISHTCEE